MMLMLCQILTFVKIPGRDGGKGEARRCLEGSRGFQQEGTVSRASLEPLLRGWSAHSVWGNWVAHRAYLECKEALGGCMTKK